MTDEAQGRRPLGAAAKALGQRPLTVHELTDHLRRRGFDDEAIGSAIETLRRDGHVDDEALAEHYLEARAQRLFHGPARMVRELSVRGVPSERGWAAWGRLVDEGRVDPEALLRRALDRKLPAGRAAVDRKEMRRVYNALLRAGFEASEVMTALFSRTGGVGELDEE